VRNCFVWCAYFRLLVFFIRFDVNDFFWVRKWDSAIRLLIDTEIREDILFEQKHTTHKKKQGAFKKIMSAKKTTKVADLIPNNFKEQPQLIEGKTRVFEDKVAAKVDGLELLGKFLTIFQVLYIWSKITARFFLFPPFLIFFFFN